MKKNAIKIIKIITLIMLITYTLLSAHILSRISLLNVISTKYLLIITAIYLITLLISYSLMLSKKSKSLIRILIGILSVGGIICVSVGLNYLNIAENTVKSIIAKDHQIDTYYVVVHKDSDYTKLTQLENKTIGIYENNSVNYDKVLKKINKTINIKEVKKDTIIDVGKQLMNKEIDSLIISSTNIDVLNKDINDFEDNIKKLETYEYKITTDKIDKEVNVTNESFNVLISGIDKAGNISTVSNSDVNMVATINPNTYEILLTVIPRDYYVQLHGTTGRRDKLTHAGVYGINTSVKTIENILDIDINYYVRVNFTTLIKVVDSIGGVTVYNDMAFKHKYYFKKGEIYLNGDQAINFSRERRIFASGDVQRGKNQQKVLTAIINKVTNSPSIITNYKEIMNTLSNSFETNMDEKSIYSLINLQTDKMPVWKISSINVTGFDSSNYTYSYPNQLLYVMEPNYDTVKYASNKIDETMNQVG